MSLPRLRNVEDIPTSVLRVLCLQERNLRIMVDDFQSETGDMGRLLIVPQLDSIDITLDRESGCRPTMKALAKAQTIIMDNPSVRSLGLILGRPKPGRPRRSIAQIANAAHSNIHLPASAAAYESCIRRRSLLSGVDALPHLKTLRLSGWIPSMGRPDQINGDFRSLESIPWSALKCLHLSDVHMVRDILSRFGPRLSGLQSLGLCAYPSRSSLDEVRENIAKVSSMVSEFLSDLDLEHLELDGFTNWIPLDVIATRNLRSLRLHAWEFYEIHVESLSTMSMLRAEDVKQLATRSPMLRNLEIDVADIDKFV